jgi:hypothetical protein
MSGQLMGDPRGVDTRQAGSALRRLAKRCFDAVRRASCRSVADVQGPSHSGYSPPAATRAPSTSTHHPQYTSSFVPTPGFGLATGTLYNFLLLRIGSSCNLYCLFTGPRHENFEPSSSGFVPSAPRGFAGYHGTPSGSLSSLPSPGDRWHSQEEEAGSQLHGAPLPTQPTQGTQETYSTPFAPARLRHPPDQFTYPTDQIRHRGRGVGRQGLTGLSAVDEEVD